MPQLNKEKDRWLERCSRVTHYTRRQMVGPLVLTLNWPHQLAVKTPPESPAPGLGRQHHASAQIQNGYPKIKKEEENLI